jgi:hypothetical protein
MVSPTRSVRKPAFTSPSLTAKKRISFGAVFSNVVKRLNKGQTPTKKNKNQKGGRKTRRNR